MPAFIAFAPFACGRETPPRLRRTRLHLPASATGGGRANAIRGGETPAGGRSHSGYAVPPLSGEARRLRAGDPTPAAPYLPFQERRDACGRETSSVSPLDCHLLRRTRIVAKRFLRFSTLRLFISATGGNRLRCQRGRQSLFEGFAVKQPSQRGRQSLFKGFSVE